MRKSSFGPEGCLAAMIKNMPEMATLLLDKCRSHEGSKDHPDSYKVMYDFFCLESKGNAKCILNTVNLRIQALGFEHTSVFNVIIDGWALYKHNIR